MVYLKTRLIEITELLLDFKTRHKGNKNFNATADLYTNSLVCYASRAGMRVKMPLCQDMGEGVGGVGSRHGEGGEKDGVTPHLHCVDQLLNTYREWEKKKKKRNEMA